jgi:hypothetical protein
VHRLQTSRRLRLDKRVNRPAAGDTGPPSTAASGLPAYSTPSFKHPAKLSTGSGALSSPSADGGDEPVWNRRHRSRCSILLTSQNTRMLRATNKTPELIPKSDLHGARCGYVFPYNDAASASMSCWPCSGSSIALSRMPKAMRRTPARPWFCSRQRSDPQEMIAPLRSKVSRASARFSQCALEFARTGLRCALEGLWRRWRGAEAAKRQNRLPSARVHYCSLCQRCAKGPILNFKTVSFSDQTDLVLESQQSAQSHKLVNVPGGQDSLDPWFLRGGVYFVQKMLGGRLGKQRLYTREKSAVLHKIWTGIRRIIAPLVSDRGPFSQGRGSVEIDFDVCGGHGTSCDCLHT